MSEKRLWNQKLTSIKSNHANFKIASELWALFDKELRSRVPFIELEPFFCNTLAFLNLSKDISQTRDYLQQLLYFNYLNQHENFSNGESAYTLFEFLPNSEQTKFRETLTSSQKVAQIVSLINFDTFFDLLISIFASLVLNSKSSFFQFFWEYIYLQVVEIRQENSIVIFEDKKPNCLSSAMIKDEVTFNCFFMSEEKNIMKEFIYRSEGVFGLSKKLKKPERVQIIGRKTQIFLEEMAADSLVNSNLRYSGNLQELMENIMAQEKFYTFYCIEVNNSQLFLNLAIRSPHLFELVSPKEGGKDFYKDLLTGEFYQDINYIDRFTRLFNLRKNPYNVEQAKTLGFENENRSVNERILKANKLAEKNFPQITAQTKGDQANYLSQSEVLAYANSIEGIESQINDRELFFDQLQEKLCGEWAKDNLLRLAHEKPLRILIIGKRFSGKSQLAKSLSKIINVDFVDIDDLVTFTFKELEGKMAEYNEALKEVENSVDPETGVFQLEKPEIPFGLCELERLSNGESLSVEFLRKIFTRKVNDLISENKGFVIEFSSLMVSQNFFDQFLSTSVTSYPIIEYIINFKLSDEDSLNRANQFIEIFQYPENENPSLLYMNSPEIKERKLQASRSEFLKDSEGLTEPQREIYESLAPDLKDYLENPENFKPFAKEEIHKGSSTSKQIQKDQLKEFQNFDMSLIKDYAIKNQIAHIQIETEGQTLRNILKAIFKNLHYPKFRPAYEIENASSLADLQEIGRDIGKGDPRRIWSFYKNIDSVDLIERNIIKFGTPENAIDYHNYILVFANTENKITFLKNPNRYLKNFPSVHGKINLGIFSPKNETIQKIASDIAKKYNLHLVDLVQFLKDIINGNEKCEGRALWETEDHFLALQDFLASLQNGQAVASSDLLKLFLLKSGSQFELKFDGEAELKILTEKNDPKAKKRILKKEARSISLANLVSKTENQKLREEFLEKLKSTGEISEDILSQFSHQIMISSFSVLPKKGFLFYNSISNQTDLSFIEGLGLLLDKTISFWSKENEGDDFLRETGENYDVEKGFSLFDEFRSYLKTVNQTDALLEIDFTEKEVQDSKSRIIDFIDPFKTKIDSEDFKCNYDFAALANGKEIAVFGSFGRFCPVSIIDRGWFFFCNPEANNLQIENQIYCFASEEYKTRFQKNYLHYTNSLAKIDLNILAEGKSRIFAMGAIGSGLRTLTKELFLQTGLEFFDLKAELLKEKVQYIKHQMLSKIFSSGFSEEAFEENEQILNDLAQNSAKAFEKYEPADSELDQKFELDLLEKTLLSSQGKIILLEVLFSEEEQIIFKGNLKEMLRTLNLVPDHLIVFKSGEFITLQRLFKPEELKKDFEAKLLAIKKSNNLLIEAKRQELYLARLEEDKKADIEDLEVDESGLELMAEFDIGEELEKVRSSIISRRNTQLELIQDFLEHFKEPETDIFLLNSELPMHKLENSLKLIWGQISSKRKLHIFQSKILNIKDNEDDLEISCETKIEKMIKLGCHRLSQFGKKNCLRPYERLDSFNFNFIYNGHIYFVGNQAELNWIKENPTFLENKPSVFKPKILTPKIIFLQNITNSFLRKEIQTKFGLKIISLKILLEQISRQNDFRNTDNFEISDFDLKFSCLSKTDLQIPEIFPCANIRTTDILIKSIRDSLTKGQPLSDTQKVYLIYRAINQAEKNGEGFILESFPENANQLRMLIYLNCLPSLVFSFKYSESECKKQIASDEPIFAFFEEFSKLLKFRFSEFSDIEHFFSNHFQNLYTLNPEKPWKSNFEIISSLIDANLEATFQAVNLFNKGEPYSLGMLPVSKFFIQKSAILEGRASILKWINYQMNEICNYSLENIQFFKGKCLFDAKTLKLKTSESLPEISERHRKSENSNEPHSDFANMLINPSRPLNLHKNFNGNCPVCFAKNISKEGLENLRLIIDGSFIAMFCCVAHLHEFFISPKIFLARGMQKNQISQQISSNSVIFDIQKKLIEEIALIMNQVCHMKLKHPELTIKQTTLVLTSIFLKLRNPLKGIAYRKKYESKLQAFLKTCKETQKISQELAVDFKIPSKIEKENISKQISELFNNLNKIQRAGLKDYFGQFII